MKKVQVLLVAVSWTMMMASNLHSQIILEDFEGGSGLTWIAQDGQYFSNVFNPDPDPVNSSPQVGGYTKSSATGFSLFYTILPQPLDISAGGSISIQFRSPVLTGVLLKLESTGPSSNQFETSQPFTVTNDWVNYTFDVSGAAGFNDLDQLILFFDPGQLSGDTYHIDNIVLNNITLPVTWGQIDARAHDNRILLTWQTLQEINCESFIVQHALDGKSYASIGKVDGSGNSDQPISYEYTIDQPSVGMHYFRIKQVDYDGHYDISKQVNVLVDIDAVKVYPNPASDILIIESAVEEYVVLTAHDGNKVREWKTVKGTNKFDISTLPKSVYFLSNKIATWTNQIVIQ